MKFRIILATLMMFVLQQCTSKNVIMKNVRPIKLQIGISLDSAQQLLKNASWVWDSMVAVNPGKTHLRFENIHLPHVDYPLEVSMWFDGGRLSQFVMSQFADREGSIKDYEQLLASVQSGYGVPSDSGDYYYLLDGIKYRKLFARWGDPIRKGGIVYAVRYTSVGGGADFFGRYSKGSSDSLSFQ